MLFKEPDQTSEEEIIPEAKKDEAREEIPTPDRLETISTTNDKDSSGSEYNDSDAHSGDLRLANVLPGLMKEY